MNIKSIFQKTAVILSGLLAVAVFLEAGLRLTGFVSLRKTMSDSRSKAGLPAGTNVILCVGDSFTFGLGAPEGMSYPAQLERMGKEQGFNLAVVNRGQAAANTSMILNRLEDNLSGIRPDIVLVLAGGANTWNTYEMPAANDSWLRRIGGFVSRLRVLRLLRLLGLNLSDACLKRSPSVGLLDEDVGFPVFGRSEAVEAKKDETSRKPDIGEAGRTTQRENLLERGMEMFYAGRYNDALVCFEQLKELSPDKDDAYCLIYETYMAQGRVDDAVLFLKSSLLEQPQLMQLRRDAVVGLLVQNRIQEAVDIVLAGLRQKPLSRQAVNVVMDFFMFIDDGNVSESAAELVGRIQEENLLPPQLLASLNAVAKKGGAGWVNKWVLTDMEDIIDLCRSYGAKVLVQNYPENAAMSDLFFHAATLNNTQFLNQRRSFLRLPEDERRLYFAPDGHCNERGYERMAVNILKKLSGLGWLEKAKT